ncbi:type II toxin-antitoxin system HicB family antitoxin [Diplocloster hominis]|uniref:type II toxin-antitoxin system HicB family antitoxin n=1 Tax=Diplocloster hominis TaxID=3079010 RepID=UPI0031BB4F37
MKFVYPACFYPCEEHSGYTVVVPDLPGCVTEGNSIADAIEMAVDAASGWILGEIEEGNSFPGPSDYKDVQLDPDYGDGFVNLIVLDMDAYTEKFGDKAVRKNLTIPAWLNTYAETHNINFSKVLQDSLMEMAKK